MNRAACALALGGVFLFVGCTNYIGSSPTGSGGAGGGSSTGGSSGTGAQPGGSGGQGGQGGQEPTITLPPSPADIPAASACADGVPGPRRMRRLSAPEFAASIRSIFHGSERAGRDRVRGSHGARVLDRRQHAAGAGVERLAVDGQRRGGGELGGRARQAGAVRELLDGRRGLRAAVHLGVRGARVPVAVPRQRCAVRAVPGAVPGRGLVQQRRAGGDLGDAAVAVLPLSQRAGHAQRRGVRSDADRGRQQPVVSADRRHARRHADRGGGAGPGGRPVDGGHGEPAGRPVAGRRQPVPRDGADGVHDRLAGPRAPVHGGEGRHHLQADGHHARRDGDRDAQPAARGVRQRGLVLQRADGGPHLPERRAGRLLRARHHGTDRGLRQRAPGDGDRQRRAPRHGAAGAGEHPERVRAPGRVFAHAARAHGPLAPAVPGRPAAAAEREHDAEAGDERADHAATDRDRALAGDLRRLPPADGSDRVRVRALRSVRPLPRHRERRRDRRQRQDRERQPARRQPDVHGAVGAGQPVGVPGRRSRRHAVPDPLLVVHVVRRPRRGRRTRARTTRSTTKPRGRGSRCAACSSASFTRPTSCTGCKTNEARSTQPQAVRGLAGRGAVDGAVRVDGVAAQRGPRRGARQGQARLSFLHDGDVPAHLDADRAVGRVDHDVQRQHVAAGRGQGQRRADRGPAERQPRRQPRQPRTR